MSSATCIALKSGFSMMLSFLTLAGVYTVLDRPNDEALEAARQSLRDRGLDPDGVKHLAVIDFDKPSFFRRLTIYGPGDGVNQYLVSHGKNTGSVFAENFSNVEGSYCSSLGLYLVGHPYRGRHGVSLRLHGLDRGLNCMAYERAIVFHSAYYVGFDAILTNLFIGKGPRIGCSLGCPAVSLEKYAEILSKLTPGTYLYHYSSKCETSDEVPDPDTD